MRSKESVDLWNIYAAEFEKRWGMDREVSAVVGARSKQVFAAEFKENGVDTYRSSVILPIRNAFYSAAKIDERAAVLADMALTEPILDYGCGVGLQLLYLKRHGYSDLYGYEVPGIQHDIMVSIFRQHGIREWDGKKVSTILCQNVLEHVKDPVKLLKWLFDCGDRVIANICTDDDEPHIAPHDQLDKCRIMLEERGTLYRAA